MSINKKWLAVVVVIGLLAYMSAHHNEPSSGTAPHENTPSSGTAPHENTNETLTETCGHYSAFHGNPEAYNKAIGRAMIAECIVFGTEQVTWRRYGDDPKGQIAAAKERARTFMRHQYPGISDACVDGLLAASYTTVSNNEATRRGCMQNANDSETARQLSE